jgi:RNA polymerase sigma-70 factor (ECF subfamily)
VPEAPEHLASLFRRANRGDEAAYRQLLIALTPWLRGIVRKGLLRAGRSPDECEDIVQETLIAVHLKKLTWDESQPVEPWAYAIANYKLIDFLRRRGTHGHVPIDELADVLPAGPEPEAESTIDRNRLLAMLPERHRHVVQRMTIDGHSAREVAVALGMTEGAVRVTLHRALKAMGDAFRRGST